MVLPFEATGWCFLVIAFPYGTIAHGVYIEIWLCARKAIGRRYKVHAKGSVPVAFPTITKNPYFSGYNGCRIWRHLRPAFCSFRTHAKRESTSESLPVRFRHPLVSSTYLLQVP
jgi:hypothetical protein